MVKFSCYVTFTNHLSIIWINLSDGYEGLTPYPQSVILQRSFVFRPNSQLLILQLIQCISAKKKEASTVIYGKGSFSRTQQRMTATTMLLSLRSIKDINLKTKTKLPIEILCTQTALPTIGQPGSW